MTEDEKVGQLNESSDMVMHGITTEKPDDLIFKGRVGSILWQMNVKEINRLQHIAVEKSRLHIPSSLSSTSFMDSERSFLSRSRWRLRGDLSVEEVRQTMHSVYKSSALDFITVFALSRRD